MPKQPSFRNVDAGGDSWRRALADLLSGTGLSGFQLTGADAATRRADHDALAQLLGDAAETATGSRDFGRWIDLQLMGSLVMVRRRTDGADLVPIDSRFARAVEDLLLEAQE
jgi:hypothetical protein